MQLLSLVETIGGGVRPPRNEQVRGSIPRGGSTALIWAYNPGQSLLWTGRVLTNLILSPLMESIACLVAQGLILAGGDIPTRMARIVGGPR